MSNNKNVILIPPALVLVQILILVLAIIWGFVSDLQLALVLKMGLE